MFDAEFLMKIPSLYAYLAILVGTFLEGETLVIVGGALAHQGYLRLPLLAACAVAGSFTSDQLMFFLGRKYGKPFLEARPKLHDRAMRATRLINRHETMMIFGFRFIYGVRNVTPLLLGIRGVDPKKFLLLNGLGAIVWAISFSLIGYAAGTALKSFLEKFDKFHNVALIALLVLGIGVAVWYFWRKRRK